MKKTFKITALTLILATAAIISCNEKEEEPPVVYRFAISSVSKSEVYAGDTITLNINWHNSEKVQNLTVKVNDTPCTVLGMPTENSVRIVLPEQLLAGENVITITHPNGVTAEQKVTRIFNFRIRSISAMTGTFGDVITITGADLKHYDGTTIRINTRACEIVEHSDSKITFKVPEGSGNGKMQIQLFRGSHRCTPARVIEAGMFDYQFKPNYFGNRVKSWSDGVTNYVNLERNHLGQVTKRSAGNNTQIISYNIVNDQVDSIKIYNQSGSLTEYRVYTHERYKDSTVLHISIYSRDGNLRERQEHTYMGRRIIRYALFMDGQYRFVNKHTYQGNMQLIERSDFNANGDVTRVDHFHYELDINNGQLPDVGISGYGYTRIYPEINQFGRPGLLYYDEFGRFIRAEADPESCVTFPTYLIRSYVYE